MSSSTPQTRRTASRSASIDGPAIETDALSKVYPGDVHALVDLGLRVERGEVFGFLGPNGAGKTTTIRLLLDLIRPTSGRALLLGLDSRRNSVEARRHVGYLSGDLRLTPRLTGRRQLEFLAGLRGGIDQGLMGELVERLDADLDRPIRDLSKGNRQKLGLVQALMHRPQLLVLDEPTTGLDPIIQEEFRRLVREAAGEGRTVFLSSHSLDEVQHVADRVGIVRAGRLVAVESVQGLLGRSVRHVILTFGAPVPSAEFASLPSVRSVEADGVRIRLSVHGSIDPVVKAAARHDVRDLVSTPADLEEIFLAYYRDQPGDGDVP
jgi:ABC-2 type transport system ATP-binding protein